MTSCAFLQLFKAFIVIDNKDEAIKYLNKSGLPENKLVNVISTPDIKVITGVRRSGKSKLLEAFKTYVCEANPNANIIHVDFNRTQFEHLKEYHALNDYIESLYDDAKDNFVFIDLYCHGCPSLYVWTKYQDYIKQKLNISKFDKVEFRSKVKGWGSFYVVVVVVDGRPVFISNPKEDGFYELFFCDQVLNDGCRDCQLRGTLEYTDIRLGDFWGKKFLDNHRGVSGVSLASDRGKEVFEKITRNLETQKCEYDHFLPYQSWGREYHPNMDARKAFPLPPCFCLYP